MAAIIGLLLVVFCIGVVLYPFLKARLPGAGSGVGEGAGAGPSLSVQELMEKRRAIYADLETLELEREMGYVDDVDYRERERDYRMAAAATFRDQDRLEDIEAEVEDAISQELTRWRAGQQAGSSHAYATCAACGQILEAPTGQCPHCGQGAGGA